MALWSRDSYDTPLNALFNYTIIEYDMKSANTSLAREFDLLPEEEIRKIENLPKKEREIAIGCIKRDTEGYSAKEKIAFEAARKFFFEQNEILEEEVVSIHRDAIFVTRYVEHEQVTKNINFRKKNAYTSYVNLGVKIFKKPEGLDIKGIDDEIYETKHSMYFGSFLNDMIHRIEATPRDSYLRYIRDFYDQYKWRKLDPGYYREFNARSNFHYFDGRYADEEYTENLELVDTSYNLQLILKFLMMLL
jgi:hypothetical protein